MHLILCSQRWSTCAASGITGLQRDQGFRTVLLHQNKISFRRVVAVVPGFLKVMTYKNLELLVGGFVDYITLFGKNEMNAKYMFVLGHYFVKAIYKKAI